MVIRLHPKNKEIFLNVQDIVTIYLEKEVEMPKQSGPSNPAVKKRKQMGTHVHTNWQTKQENKFVNTFKKEHFIKSRIEYNDWFFVVRGRIDGIIYDNQKDNEKILVEEIKSTLDDGIAHPKKDERIAYLKRKYPHYLMQLQTYLYLMQLQDEFKSKTLIGKLIFINIRNHKHYTFEVLPEEKLLTKMYNAFEKILLNFQDKIIQIDHEKEILKDLKFPYKSLRNYQQQIIDDTYEIFEKKTQFGVCAPTGLGKTISTLFPAIKYALKNNKKIFYTTAKNSQQEIVYKTLQDILNPIPKALQTLIQAVFIVGKEQMCINEEFICHEASCQYLENYSEKLNLEGILIENSKLKFGSLFTVDRLKRLGKKRMVCPFELGLDLSLESRIIVGDYNYIFDPRVFLRRHFDVNSKDKEFILLIDEAHNLPGRVKQYFTINIEPRSLQTLYQKLEPGSKFRIWFQTFWNLVKNEFEKISPSENPKISNFNNAEFAKIINQFNTLADAYFMKLLINKISLNSEDPILNLYYFLLRLESALNISQPDSVHIVYNTLPSHDIEKKLRILCLDASFWIKKKINQFHSTIFISATLVPTVYYSELFGLKNLKIEVYPSPFPPENKRLLIIDSVETQYRKRKDSISKIIQIFNFLVENVDKKVLVFFSSYDYLFLFLKSLKEHNSFRLRDKIFVISKDVSSYKFKSMLQSIKRKNNIKIVVTVLGSVIGESIEFPQGMLNGLVIIGPGFPTVDFELTLLKKYYEQQNLSGDRYSIQFPAISRIVQALGRLIRSESDKGFMLLIGNQYSKNLYRYLPRYLYEHIEDLFPVNSWEGILSTFLKNPE
ncbi:MAG: ATP-dependent DNA helicase [Candidatus Hodarchaeales archaeon]